MSCACALTGNRLKRSAVSGHLLSAHECPVLCSRVQASLGKILKCAGNDDAVTLRAADDADAVTLVFENEGTFSVLLRIGYFKQLCVCVACLSAATGVSEL